MVKRRLLNEGEMKAAMFDVEEKCLLNAGSQTSLGLESTYVHMFLFL